MYDFKTDWDLLSLAMRGGDDTTSPIQHFAAALHLNSHTIRHPVFEKTQQAIYTPLCTTPWPMRGRCWLDTGLGRRSWTRFGRLSSQGACHAVARNPKTGLRTFIASFAERHGVSSVRSGSSALADIITRLAGDEPKPDNTEKLVIALRRAKVIDGRTMLELLSRYFAETRCDSPDRSR